MPLTQKIEQKAIAEQGLMRLLVYIKAIYYWLFKIEYHERSLFTF